MISRKELNSISLKTDYTLAQIEKDFLQHLFLKFLYDFSDKEFIFKGGTALQKCFGLNRFSEDLDFTYQGEIKAIPKVIDKISGKMSEFYDITIEKIIEKKPSKNSEKYKCKILGPLYTGKVLTIVTLRLDISYREEILCEPVLKEVIPKYDQISSYKVYLMSNEELMAEKIRAIITRDLARDVYDLWYLLGKNIPINSEYVNKKLNYYDLIYSEDLLLKKINNKSGKWKQEISTLIKTVPDFHSVVDSIITHI